MAGRISIPIEFEVARESAASVIRTLENQLAKLKPGTAIYDSIKKQITDATKLLGKVDRQFSFGYNTEGDISRTEKNFISLAAVIDTVNAAFERLDVSALNLDITEGEFGGIATQVKAVNAELQVALANLQKLQGTKVKELFDSRETKKLGQFTAEQKESSGLAVYEKIGRQMEAIGLRAADAETKVQSLERALTTLQQTQTRKGYTSASTDAEHASAARIYGLTGTSNEKIGDVRARIMEELQGAFKSDGTKKSTTDAVVTEILTAFEIDESEITAALTAKVSERQERLRQIVYNLDESAGKGITSDKVKHARSRTHGMAREYAGAVALQQQIQNTSNELTEAQTEKNSFENQLAGLTAAFQSLRTKLQAKKIIGADGTVGSSEIQTEINQLRVQVEALLAQLVNQVKSSGGKSIIPPSGDSGRGGLNSLNETKAFEASMQNTIKQWFSVQQIINTVKNGIRQAYQDIQGLDKAMTNIAVVTDMSVSDLWGKINEYMSIAQQYGVTTQGVYEVSQLYYQQGLSTNEVMAATTETLKLARIAGMGYAEAADAMTVAIRSFKMDMSDAATVTNVYSKVAAITASDSEELAIAMSKTASSAESVGSSFENTTAMLAVMIETTRESAQNLGSALKSIISRYGEMKVGLTVDSEGEKIDYNKVDTALKSIGISIKDAQGQFRDFDDVIFELSKKWDSLDKNTQRYIATIMAGNRQQSRFIALVDNGERLEEVTGAAQDSEDAGLLQYAKTLDSVETKLNNIKTSFQQFYMSIFNGKFVGSILDFVNSIIKALNKLGTLGSIFNLITLIKGIKTGLNLITGLFSTKFSEIYRHYKSMQQQMTNIANTESKKRANIQATNEKNGQAQIGNNYIGKHLSQADRAKLQSQNTTLSKVGKASSILSLLGLGLNLLGTSTIANKTFGKSSTAVGTGINAVGNTASGVGSGMGIGAAIGSVVPVIGTVAGTVIGGVIGGLIPAINGLEDTIEAVNQIEKEHYENLKETTEEKNVERAQAKDEYQNLANLIKQVENAKLIKNNSADDYQKWLDANNSLVEAYPELLGYIDQEGNAIADLTGKTEILTYYMQRAASATAAYYEAKIDEIEQKIQLGEAGLSTEYGSKDKNNEFFLNGLGTKITYQDVYDKAEELDVNLAAALSSFNSLILRYSLNERDVTGAIDNSSVMGIFGDYTTLYEDGSGRATAEANLIQRMISVGALAWNSKSNQYELSSNYADYITGQSAEKELSTTKRQGAIAGITNAAALHVEDDNLEQINGYSALIATYALDILNKPYEDLLNIAEDEYSALIADFLVLSTTWDTQGQTIIKNLYSQLTNYSLPELQKIFNDHLGGMNNNLYRAFELEWYNQNAGSYSRQIEAIYGQDFFTTHANKLGVSEAYKYAEKNGTKVTAQDILWWQSRFQKTANYSDWLEHMNWEDSAKNRQLYYEELNYMLADYQGQLNNFLMKASTQTKDQYTSYLAKETKISENKGTEGQKAALRLAAVQNLLVQMWDPNTVLGKVLKENEAYVEFSNLLLADNIGTSEWATALSEFENKYNTEIANFENYVFENFNTQLNTVSDNLNKDLTTYKNYSNKQSSGFSLDEARSLAKTLGGDEGTVEKYFTTTAEGLLVLKDFESAMKALLSKNTIKAKNLRSDLNTILNPLQNYTLKGIPGSDSVIQYLLDQGSALNIEEAVGILSEGFGYNKAISRKIAEQINSGVIQDINSFYNAIDFYNASFQKALANILTVKDNNRIETYLIDTLGIDAELAASLATIIATGEFKTVEELTAYLQEYYAELGLALDQAYGQVGALIEAQRKNSKIEELKSSATAKGIHFDKLEAQKLLASQGLTGYTKEQIADLALAFNWKEGADFILQDDGTYDISYQALTKNGNAFLNSLEMEYRNQLLALLDSETNKALEAISNLGASAAKGDTGVYGTAFGDIMGYQVAESLIPQYIKAAHEGTLVSGKDPAAKLKEWIAKQISEETGQEITATNPEVIKRYNEMMAGYSDQLDNNIVKFLELKEKELFGTITKAESEELKMLKLDSTLQNTMASTFSNVGASAAEKYVALMEAAMEAMASGDANWEKMQSYVKKGYSAKLAQLASTQGFKDLDTYNVEKNIAKAKGQYSEDTLSSLFSQIYAEDKIKVDMTDFTQYFEIDPETKNWVLKAGVDINDFFASEYGESVPAWITEAFSTSEAQKQVNDAIKLGNLGTSATSTIGSMMSDLANTSLSDLVSLYESIYGKDNFADSGLLESYQAALEAAKRGETSALIAILQTLTQAAINTGADVDTAQIQATVKDAHNKLVSGLITSINNGLSGTLSNIDFNSLIEQIGGDPEVYRKYVTETYDGLKLSAEGVLVIASQLIDKFGNISLVAESLVTQLGGSGTLGSYKDVDDLINEIINDTNHWAHGNEDILNLLYRMRSEYSQLAEDARFDFMNQDNFNGAADNWYTFTNNMSTAINKLKSAFEKGGKIDYKSFDNIVTWIADLSVDGLDTKLGETGITLGKFTDAVLATVDATGNLDLSAAAAKLGISMDDMAGALEGGLQEVAKQQVAYWEKYLDFLKGLKKLQDAQAEVQLEIPIKNEATGKWTYKGNTYDSWEALAAVYAGDVAAAQQYFENFSYTGANGTTITLSGENNPLNFILGKIGAFDLEGNLALKEGMAAQIGQYMAQVYAWIDTLTADDIKKYVNEDTGEITIPWDEVLQIELDTSTTPEANTTNAEEASEQTQDAAEGAAESALTASGATLNGDGSYTYTLDDMTLKIQMGANGSVEIDLTNATGTLPTAAELRKVFEGKPGFSATDDNNWVFIDPNLGFSIKCSNGTLSFDTSGMTAPPIPTGAELSTILGTSWTTTDGGKTYTATLNGVTFVYNSASGSININASSFQLTGGLDATSLSTTLGTTWTTTDGGKTYTTNLNGVSFVYNSATGQININASSFQLAGGLDTTSLAAILDGTWTTEDNGATYTATIAGTSFVYESSSGLVKIDGSKFTLLGGLSATELANILRGSWSSPDGGITYESTINGVTFTYKSASGTVEIDSSKFTLSAGLSATQLNRILGGDWKGSEDGTTYTSVIGGVTFTYKSNTGTVEVNPTGFTVSADLTPKQLKILLGGNWTSEDEGKTYTSTINGVTFTYESTTGKLVVTPPTTATEPTNADFVTLMQSQGWTHANGVYTKNFSGGTLTYNATAGTLKITPSSPMPVDDPDMATLLDGAFGVGGWKLNKNGGYDILNAATGEVLYTIPAKVTIIPTEGSNVGQGDNGLTADVDVTLTPNTKKIDSVLSGYEQKTINLTIDIDKNSLIKSSQHFETAWNTLSKVKNQGMFDFGSEDKNLAEESFNYLVTEASELSKANKLTQEDVALIKALGNAMNDAGINVDAAMKTVEELSTVEENTVLTDLAAFAEAFNGANLFGNLTALTALLTAMNNPAAVSLDLTGFITQLQFMSELELDDEEINNFVTAITALTTAITALPTEVDVSVKVSAGNSYNVIDSIKNALDSIKDKTVTIVTQHVDSGSDKNHGAPTSANYAGNVSGLALAKGNATDKLLIGAHLAGKTLVGELGPELAVYDNQYHLLGRNGAEFVDLPNDAIVFNNRQTVGIIKGQAGYRGQALVNGNVTGPAAAGGIDAAISAVENIIKLWSNITDSSLSDLLSGGSSGGGGSGNTIKAVTEELQEWYNLSRQIKHIEQEINNLIAERSNLLESDGAAYLRSLREEQALLRDQVATQEVLSEYQQLQLKRQADQINQNNIWSKFLEVDENGLLQYKNGNEANDGKGALDVLQGLNEMSGEKQVEYITETLGYSYTNADGKKLEGEKLVKQFFQEFQDQIDNYDSLYDTVHKTKEKLQQLVASIEKVNQEIKKNQMDLEQDIFNILVDAWEKEIKALEEQKELIEKANKAYVDGLKEALSAEKDLYEKNETTEKRESLQRQLSLLRRSGGSASEIADLEEQLNDTLKDEYFKNQERMIENIEDANKEQVRKLEEQITLQKESLEYQKENGVLWTEVYKVLAGTKEEILKFMQGKHTEFFSKSALQQEEMLTDWAHKIGIYTEDRQYENHTKVATSIWDSNDLWNGEILKGMEGRYKGLKDNQKESLKKLFTDTYANSMIKGATEEESRKLAEEEVKKSLNQAYDENGNLIEEPEPVKPSSGSTNYVSVKYAVTPAGAKAAGCSISGPSIVTVGSEKGGLKLQTANGWDFAGFSSSDSSIASYSNGAIKAYKKGSVTITAKFVPSKSSSGTKAEYHSGAVDSGTIDTVTGTLSETISNFGGFKITDGKTVLQDSGEKYKTKDLATAAAKTALSSIDKKKHPNAKYTLYGFSQGGLVDYTGLAMVHGTQSKPEAFLNASQTAQIKEALEATNGKENLLSGLHSTIDQLRSLIHNISTIDNSINSSITVAPGAVVINVDQLADSYDVEALSADIMNRMVSIASKATNRGVNRR